MNRNRTPRPGPSDVRARLVPAAVVFALALPLFARMCSAENTIDHQGHLRMARELARGEAVQPHPLYHVLLVALSGGDPALMVPAAVLVLSGALGVRAWLSASLFGCTPARGAVLCVALALAMPLPNWWRFPNIYLGQIPANMWHNPTAILAMPFAVGMFLLALRQLEAPTVRGMAAFGAVTAVGLLAKPNYALAFLPVFGSVMLGVYFWRWRTGREGAGAAAAGLLAAFAPAAAVLAYQFHALKASGDGGPVYAPFLVWGYFSSHHVLPSTLLGTAFPVATALCYPREARADRGLALAWATLAAAVAYFALFAESGSRRLHGNFSWGLVPACHIVFVASAALLVRQPAGLRRFVPFLVLALHAVSGTVHLVRSLQDPVRGFTY